MTIAVSDLIDLLAKTIDVGDISVSMISLLTLMLMTYIVVQVFIDRRRSDRNQSSIIDRLFASNDRIASAVERLQATLVKINEGETTRSDNVISAMREITQQTRDLGIAFSNYAQTSDVRYQDAIGKVDAVASQVVNSESVVVEAIQRSTSELQALIGTNATDIKGAIEGAIAQTIQLLEELKVSLANIYQQLTTINASISTAEAQILSKIERFIPKESITNVISTSQNRPNDHDPSPADGSSPQPTDLTPLP